MDSGSVVCFVVKWEGLSSIGAMPHYLYLHGFASSPRSTKARDLSDRFQALGIPLELPDLNQGDFTGLTLTRQLQQVGALLPPASVPVTLIGSSFGGLTAAWLGQRHPQIERLILLAPAFQFLAHWVPRLGQEQIDRWREQGVLSVYHYGEAQMLPLRYTFLLDTSEYRDEALQRPVPTLILHGIQDEVIPVQASVDYAASRPWVKLVTLDSDHALTNVSDKIWAEIQTFCWQESEG